MFNTNHSSSYYGTVSKNEIKNKGEALPLIWEWSLITGRGRGGATKREGGQVKFYPYEKGLGGPKSFSHIKGGGGGHKTFWGILNTGA